MLLHALARGVIGLEVLLAASVAAAHPGEALAVAGPAPTPAIHWSAEPWLVGALLAVALLYRMGAARHARAAASRRVSRWPEFAWWTGWSALWLALLSPLDQAGAQLFSAHMIQHQVLMLVAAPLLVLGRPLAMFAWALPVAMVKRVAATLHSRVWQRCWRTLTLPAAACAAQALALWLWHVPVLFEAGLRNEAIHDLQHASFLVTALLFWWALVRRRHRADSVLYVFVTLLHSGLLGMLLTFAVTPWYALYADSTMAWGLTPLEDQQLGGLIMWVPGGALLIVAGLILAALWLERLERLGRPTAVSRVTPKA